MSETPEPEHHEVEERASTAFAPEDPPPDVLSSDPSHTQEDAEAAGADKARPASAKMFQIIMACRNRIAECSNRRRSKSQSREGVPKRSRHKPRSETSIRKHDARAHEIFEKIRQLATGGPVDVAVCGQIKLHQNGYDQLLELLSEDEQLEACAFHHFKLSYNKQRHLLSYELPTTVHDDVLSDLTAEIRAQLSKIASKSPTAAQVLNHIRCSRGPSTFTTAPPLDRPSRQKPAADGVCTFKNATTHSPCFVYEVCFHPRHAAAWGKIHDLIYAARGRPGMGLVLQLRHHSPAHMRHRPPPAVDHSASYSTWRWTEAPDRRNTVVRTDPRPRAFRDAKGAVVPGQLEIAVRDFVGLELCRGALPDDPAVAEVLDERIVIDHAVMAGWVGSAENWERMVVTAEPGAAAGQSGAPPAVVDAFVTEHPEEVGSAGAGLLDGRTGPGMDELQEAIDRLEAEIEADSALVAEEEFDDDGGVW
ncbi:hypothetical protein SLS58_009198 [Diplodia intermedia]|uniref:Uncharacterized protein n=1 Tax=Diplodia intermedia TaxID=856260 RepID=A0ABR3TE39_9PEZI